LPHSIEAGLLEPEGESAFTMPHKIDSEKRSVLSVYVEDVQKKLSVFDDIAAKIDLFKNIINERFLYKEIAISKTDGFSFKARDGRNLALTDLSSGEQHEIVLYYDLLFRVQPHALILIDEPEISLHVAWQEQFLKDLIKINQLRRLDAIVATHSPQIISNRWDLTIELTGPPE
jgi:predicted ATP-binding protein involved in virulence